MQGIADENIGKSMRNALAMNKQRYKNAYSLTIMDDI